MEFMTFVTMPTGAYIDPSTTTILISSISGIVIAIGAGAVLLWRKAKKRVADVLHIDENSKKEVEEELVIKEDEENK